jgi:tRNA1(Val) A37 N6-methylase TrmN6
MAAKLAPREISGLDPYKFMAVIGKQVIHPGGRASTGALLRRAQITESARVLDVGCGVAATAIEIARRHRARVTAPFLTSATSSSPASSRHNPLPSRHNPRSRAGQR